MAQRDCYASVAIGGNPANVVYSQGGIEIVENFSVACTQFSVTTNTNGFSVNDTVAIAIGYDDDNATMMTDGYVDSITAERPPGVYRIEGRDKLKKAVDYLIVAASVDEADFFNPRKQYGHVLPSAIVGDILAECGLSGLDYSSGDTGWEIGTEADGTEFQLVNAWEAIQQICAIGVWKVWVDVSGKIHFAQVLGEPGTPSASLTTGNDGNLLSASYTRSDEDLRNKIVVIGTNGDYIGVASAVSPYLPAGFYKTAVLSTDLLGSDADCISSAEANLDRFNKLTQRVAFEALGDPDVHAQSTLTITEAFTGISGDWFVSEITHTIDNDGYRMRGTAIR